MARPSFGRLPLPALESHGLNASIVPAPAGVRKPRDKKAPAPHGLVAFAWVGRARVVASLRYRQVGGAAQATTGKLSPLHTTETGTAKCVRP